MSSFALLFSKILESSIWVTGTKEVRILWITMLAMKDKEGVVRAALVGLADRAKLKKSECESALRVLMAPDPEDTSGVEGGVRVKEIPGTGWQIVNHNRYRFSTEARRAIWAETKAIQRQNAKAKPSDQEIEESQAYREVHEREPLPESFHMEQPTPPPPITRPLIQPRYPVQPDVEEI